MTTDFRIGARLMVEVGHGHQTEVIVRWRSRCRTCEAPILFARTLNGHLMPVNLPVDGQPITSHYATCPQAAEHRRRS